MVCESSLPLTFTCSEVPAGSSSPRSYVPDNLEHADLLPHRKLNESPTKVEDPAVLKLPLCTPKLKKITLHFPLGLEVVARNMKGVTIKDALDAIHKQFKKRVCVPGLSRSLKQVASDVTISTSFCGLHASSIPDSDLSHRQMTSSRSPT